MAVKVSPQTFADRWTQGLSQAGQKISDGIDSVTIAPSSLAVKNQAKMRANVLASIDNGKWAAGLSKVSLSDWQTAMKTKGVPRIATGAQAANAKMAAFAAKLIPYQNTLQATVKAMPNMTLQDNIARATAWITGMSKFQNK